MPDLTEPRLNQLDTDVLLERKNELIKQTIGILRELSLPIDYPFVVVQEARKKGVQGPRYVALLELLLEIESIKYTLCARLLPHVGQEEAGI